MSKGHTELPIAVSMPAQASNCCGGGPTQGSPRGQQEQQDHAHHPVVVFLLTAVQSLLQAR